MAIENDAVPVLQDTSSRALAVSRRGMLVGGGATMLSGCAGQGMPLPAGPAAPSPAMSLKAAAASRGRRFGSAFAWGLPGSDTGSFANPDYAALLERDCALLVPENAMKWQSIRPAAGQYDFTRFDEMVRYAKRGGFALRGHTLLWQRPKWSPDWLTAYDFGPRPAVAAADILVSHIETVTRRYRNAIYSHDVVNEAVDPETGDLVATSLSDAMGGVEPLLDLAFRTAKASVPNSQLVYNDYMSWEPGNEKHRAGVLRLLEGFRARDVPIDALGIQSHIRIGSIDPATGTAPRDERGWRAFLDAVVAMGYGLIITEFDVRDPGLPADLALRDRGVADYTSAYFDVMLAYSQLRDILAWGMTTRYSWLQSFEPREDGLLQRCCPYDADFEPLPMRRTLIDMFMNAGAV